MDIQKAFGFIRLTQKFRNIVRDVHVGHDDRYENDMEHSYQLAMFVWYLTSTNSLSYDVNKLIRYALIHDLVETYAGDTPALTSSAEKIQSKEAREDQAFAQILEEIPEFGELREVWENYKQKVDQESRLVYVLDKVMPILNELQYDSHYYSKNEITFEKWSKWLQSKLDNAQFSELEDAGFMKALLDYLEMEHERLFFEK